MQQICLIKIFLFVFGLCVGSFINVCIYRLPENISIIKPSSFCPNCKKNIKWYHNIPLLSYIFLRGKCAFCNTKISLIYPLVELLTGLIFLVNYIIYGLSVKYLSVVTFECLLLIVIFVDLKFMIIPDEVSIGGIIIGFCLSFFNKNITWVDSLLGIIIGGGLILFIIKAYYLLTKKEGMGGGDVKLLAMIGAFLGYKSIFFVIMFSSFVGSIVGIPLMLAKSKNGKYAIPFGPFLSIAAIIYIYFGKALIQAYLNLLS